MQVLYDKYKSRGFVVLGFPCNQFGNQEPHDEATIKAMVAEKYGVTYPLFSKVDVNGPSAHPIFKFLKSFESMDEDISWNFVKFLVDRSGKPVKRYVPSLPMPTLARKPILTHQTFHADSDQHRRVHSPTYSYATTTNPMTFESDIVELLA